MGKAKLGWLFLPSAFTLLLLTPAGGHLGKNAFGPLQPQVRTALSIGPSAFGLLLAAVNLPSAVLPSVTGWLYDHFSSRFVLLGTVLAVFLGQVLLFFSCITQQLCMALVAAVIFGAGAGSVNSLQHASLAVLVGQRLGEGHLGLAMGAAVGMTNIWRCLSNVLLPRLAMSFGIVGPLAAVIVVCAVSVVSGAMWVYLGSHENSCAVEHEDPQEAAPISRQISDDLAEFLPMSRQVSSGATGQTCEVWTLWMLHAFLMASSIGFSNIAPAYLEQRGDTQLAANELIARSMRIGSLGGALFGGLAADCVGRGLAAKVAASVLVLSLCLLSTQALWPLMSPFGPLFMLGLAQGSLSTIVLAWLPEVVAVGSSSAGTGLGYGVMESLAAVGEAGGNVAVGAATARWGVVTGATRVLLGIALCALSLIMVLANRVDGARRVQKASTNLKPLLAAEPMA